MATIREWLVEAGFDFTNGTILCCEDGRRPAKKLKSDSEILDKRFNEEWTGPELASMFIAKDIDKIYFPCQYDGSTWLECIHLDFNVYLAGEERLVYPGG